MDHRTNTPVQRMETLDSSLGIVQTRISDSCPEQNRPSYTAMRSESDCELRIETAVQDSDDAKRTFAKPQGWFESPSSVNAHFRPMIAPLMFTFAVKRLVDSANAAAGKSRQFFERLDWTVIEKGDKYEPRRIGFHIITDFATRIQKWIDQGRPSE